MSLVREDVYVALANLVFTDTRVTTMFKTTGRRLPHVQSVGPEACPALFMFQRPEQRVNEGKGIPAKRTLRCVFVAYFDTGDAEQTNSSLPATAINAAADVIDDVIDTPGNPANVQTLGGLVEHVYIDPTMEPYEGLLQEKSVLVAQVAMLVP